MSFVVQLSLSIAASTFEHEHQSRTTTITHFLSVIVPTLLLFSSSLANPILSDEVVVREARAEADISPHSNPYKCAKVSSPGLYCGYCQVGGKYVVLDGWNDNNVFWCNKQGGCEDLGRRTSCVNGKGPCDGRDSG
ncbi:hypothetical protein EK21DRAFT_91902 [Setomelanomma holmii]|uniref:Uncharacterized protein n=1 Tax=Setomelanomma holmii TaxID=210430 RepID=A0A9P4LJA0_9PLEO|nr:hypothetical protein EK21DRAFT_91902 [Setomelanomma holmii]